MQIYYLIKSTGPNLFHNQPILQALVDGLQVERSLLLDVARAEIYIDL
jgi:hypothetical protein